MINENEQKAHDLIRGWARLPRKQALECYRSWPETVWETKSLYYLLNQPVNNFLKEAPLNESLLESLRRDGFLNPLLVTKEYFPLTGLQRLRCAIELPLDVQQNTEVKMCRLKEGPQDLFRYYPNEEMGQSMACAYFAVLEVSFKSLFFDEQFDKAGVEMTIFEEVPD